MGSHTHGIGCQRRFDLLRTWVCEPPSTGGFFMRRQQGVRTSEPCQDGRIRCSAVRRLLIAPQAL
jgi:hypothetical protein